SINNSDDENDDDWSDNENESSTSQNTTSQNAIEKKDNAADLKTAIDNSDNDSYANEVIDFLNDESSDDRNRGTGQGATGIIPAVAPQLLTLDEVEGWNNVKSSLDGSGFNADKKQIIARVNDYLNNISPEHRDLVKQKVDEKEERKAASAFVGAYNDMEDDDILDYRKSGGNRRATGTEGAIARNGGVICGSLDGGRTFLADIDPTETTRTAAEEQEQRQRNTIAPELLDLEKVKSYDYILHFRKTNGEHTITPQQAATIVGREWRTNWQSQEIRINNNGTIQASLNN
ncbi:2551_t:CDS:2, partial [Racocetra persica]